MEAERAVGSNDFEQALGAFTDAGRLAAEIDARRQRSSHALLADLSGSWAGTLVELAELGAPVVVLTRAGNNHRGIILAVGPQLVVLAAGLDEPRVLLALDAIDAIREPGNGRRRELDTIPPGPDLASLLDEASEERARVSIVTSSGATFMGRLMAVGVDQVTLRLDGDSDSLTMPIGRIDEAVIDR
jgi:hypothetical protein